MASVKPAAVKKTAGRRQASRSPSPASPARTAKATKATKVTKKPAAAVVKTKKSQPAQEAITKDAGNLAEVPAANHSKDCGEQAAKNMDTTNDEDEPNGVMESVEHESHGYYDGEDEEAATSKSAANASANAKGKGKVRATKPAARKPAKGGAGGSRKRKNRSPTPGEESASPPVSGGGESDEEEEEEPPRKVRKKASGRAAGRAAADVKGPNQTWEVFEANRPNPHIPLRPEDRQKNGRQSGRGLIIWTRPRMVEKLILHVQYELARHQIEIPWDTIAHRLHPGSSGGAITQHLNRVRAAVHAQGHLVPPLLPKPGSRVMTDPAIRGYVRKDMDGTDSSSTRPVYFTEVCPDRKFNLPDASGFSFINTASAVDVEEPETPRKGRKPRKTSAGGGTSDNSGASANTATGTLTSGGKKRKNTAAAAREPTPDPADLDSDADYDPSVKASTQRRKSSRAKRIQSYEEEEEEEEVKEESVAEEEPEQEDEEREVEGKEADNAEEEQEATVKEEAISDGEPCENVAAGEIDGVETHGIEAIGIESPSNGGVADENDEEEDEASQDGDDARRRGSDGDVDSDDGFVCHNAGEDYEPTEEVAAALEMAENNNAAGAHDDAVSQNEFSQAFHYPGGHMMAPSANHSFPNTPPNAVLGMTPFENNTAMMSPGMFRPHLPGQQADLTPSSYGTTESPANGYYPSMAMTNIGNMPDMTGLTGMECMAIMPHAGLQYVQTSHGAAIHLYDGSDPGMSGNAEHFSGLVDAPHDPVNQNAIDTPSLLAGGFLSGGLI